MPKTPILNREAFYQKLRDGSFVDLQWNLVQTSLGAMVEPRPLRGEGSKMNNFDPYDASFTRRTEFNADTFYSLFGTYGQQIPVDFNPA